MYNITARVLDFNKLLISTNNLQNFNISKLIVKNGDTTLHINNYTTTTENSILLFIDEKITIKDYCYIIYDGIKAKALYKDIFLTSEFNKKFYYDDTLGLIYAPKVSTFKLWSPAASSVYLLLYQNGDPAVAETPLKYKMKEKNGVWNISIYKDLKNYYYTYEVTAYNCTQEAVDPYAVAVGINGLRAAIIDLKDTNPPNFGKDTSLELKHNTDAILYEINIRDISMHDSSGVIQKGKFLALTEDNTLSKKNLPTCLSHIKDLGITHVQLMPCFDFSYMSIDEKNLKNYNWGYDPENYNVPEGSFSLNPYDPKCRILEIKKMIQHLHFQNISVNMDVVYNHMFHRTQNNFEKIFPGYYFRLDDNGNYSNGSFCSNDTASEHKMMRKFIIDSLLYWAKEYHIDGFRFDLMGIHDINTMQCIYNTFKNFTRNIMLYGEGWNLNTSLDESLRATLKNAKEIPNLAFFNDIIRDTIKGSVFSKFDKGFVSGEKNLENKMRECVTGCTISIEGSNTIFISPEQSVNYVSCHDNNTLWDKFQLSNSNDTIEDKKNMVKLSSAIVLTSQGIPFLHSGVEFCRTKNGIENSFNSPDIINSLDYDRKAEFLDVYKYHKGLIKLRKEHPAFRMYSVKDIKHHLEFIENIPSNTLAFILKDNANGDLWESILVVYNANRYPVTLQVPEKTWHKVVDKYHADTISMETITSDKIEVDSLCMSVFYAL
ncbi:type I pullulanase [Clostridium sp. ZS2-4]|uniref:type I pullulanase n=1 Tax=Clostridium sp. ZS2-4 TaxID=2987703 RepID=UPI00227A3FE8|nr:type I pullulanase [Clostridium sp. ZS2-4]MCY6355818.1 type I pullulanase [Clostridium sp. ZS2-4]